MFEFLNQPNLIPVGGGFVGGAVFASLIALIRARLDRSAIRADKKIAAERISRLQSENSALETEIATLRSSEARLLKHQGELEFLAKGREDHENDLTRLVETTLQGFRKELKASETVLLKALADLPRPHPVGSPPPEGSAAPSQSEEFFDEDLDFVPTENLPAAKETVGSFEGFSDEPPAAKAESAANAFRAALKESD
jgi:hypothetical protein